MRAINLVPADARQSGFSGGKSGGAAYGLLGLLVVILLGTVVFAKSKGAEATANKDLATVQQSAAAYDQVATQYSSFQSAAADAQQRIATVKSLANARFDWAGSLRDLARLVPPTVRISQLDASVSSTASAGGGGGSQFRGQIESPAITMAGCTLTQSTAADLVVRLQAMRRVTNVTLESSKLADSHGTGVTDGSCQDYQFQIDVFFAAGSAQDSQSAVPSSTPIGTESVSNNASTTPAATTASSTSTSGN
ncbi:MAG: hypothetical protein AAGC46_04885 [Solirubrobacteraceae bacterium]|nr:hypothetical protein [Patulibacter sp.]